MKRDEFDIQVNRLLLSAENLIPEENLPDLPYMKLAPTVHDWYDFEHELWGIGEEIRQLILSEHKEMSTEQANRVCKICVDIKAKRGRQSFIMLLGKKRYKAYADKLSSALTDEDIAGHIISTLYKMGAAQYVDQIKHYITHSITWIRNEAKRYVEKYGTGIL